MSEVYALIAYALFIGGVITTTLLALALMRVAEWLKRRRAK